MASMTYSLESGATMGTIEIHDGPAKGSYRFNADTSLEEGRLLSLGSQWIAGRQMNLKIDLEKNLPELLAEMNRRADEWRARYQAAQAAEAAQAEIDRRMRAAGFQHNGLAGKIFPTDGRNF